MRNIYFDIDKLIFRDFFRNTCPFQFYRLDEEDIQNKVQRLKTLLVDIQYCFSEIETSALFSNFRLYNSDIIFCCSRFFEQLFENNASYLFLQYIYYDCDCRVEYCRKRYLTTFVVKRNIFYAFFGNAAISNTITQKSDAESALFLQFSTDLFQQYLDSAISKSTILLLSISVQTSTILTAAHEDLIENFSKLIYSASA